MSSRSSLLERRSGQLHPLFASALLIGTSLALTFFAVKTPWSGWPRPLIAIVGIVASCALHWRRQTPVILTAVGAVALVVCANPVPLWVGVYTVALGGPRRPRGAALLLALGAFGAMLIFFESLQWEILLATAGLVGLLMGIGSHAGAREQFLISSQERAERAERERHLRVQQARADERTRIAQEMHDVLGHKLTLIAIQAGALEVNAGAAAERVENGAQLIRVTAREALDELRAVLGVLRNEAGLAFDFPDPFPDLRRLVDASTAVGVAVDLRDEVGPLPLATARAVHRVVQEGLTNVHKHARGARATVEVMGAPGDDVTIVVANGVRDDGGEVLPGAGVGLIGLNERVRLLGGRLRSGPDDLGGWRLEATIPWLDAPVEEPGPVAVAVGAVPDAGENS